jgi:glycosyltransferase involved in cell wall biosynthesis
MADPITVVTATINRKSLARAVQSVQDQTLKPAVHHILFQQLMDSPIIDLPKPQHVPIVMHWLPPPQPDIATAVNLAEDLAQTPLVAMLDDDCWWEPNHLETLANLIELAEVDFVWGSTILHDSATWDVIGHRVDGFPAFGHIDTNEILYRRYCRERWGGVRMEDYPGLDGHRIERWVAGGATYDHSRALTVHYGYGGKDYQTA